MPSAPLALLLASASPARRSTLRAAGVDPLVQVSSVDEDAVVAAAQDVAGGPLEAADVALLLARAKAEDVVAALEVDDAFGEADADLPHGILVLGCDSVLELDGEVHGKPADAVEAVARWRRMRGRTGVLHTGHWLVDLREPDAGGTGGMVGGTASTVVHFADLDDAEVDAYVATGEPLRVAGAFTLDGLGGPYVAGIEGDPSNVIGVSLPLLRELVRELGVAWHDLRTPLGVVESRNMPPASNSPTACSLLSTRSDRGDVAALVGEVPVAPGGVAQPVQQLVAQGVGLDDVVDDQVGREPLEVDVVLVLGPTRPPRTRRAPRPLVGLDLGDLVGVHRVHGRLRPHDGDPGGRQRDAWRRARSPARPSRRARRRRPCARPRRTAAPWPPTPP